MCKQKMMSSKAPKNLASFMYSTNVCASKIHISLMHAKCSTLCSTAIPISYFTHACKIFLAELQHVLVQRYKHYSRYTRDTNTTVVIHEIQTLQSLYTRYKHYSRYTRDTNTTVVINEIQTLQSLYTRYKHYSRYT